MISKTLLRGEIDRKISNRSHSMKFGKVSYYHIGDYGKKSTANEIVKSIREISVADKKFGGRGFLVRISAPYFSDINPGLKYGVYARRGKKVGE